MVHGRHDVGRAGLAIQVHGLHTVIVQPLDGLLIGEEVLRTVVGIPSRGQRPDRFEQDTVRRAFHREVRAVLFKVRAPGQIHFVGPLNRLQLDHIGRQDHTVDHRRGGDVPRNRIGLTRQVMVIHIEQVAAWQTYTRNLDPLHPPIGVVSSRACYEPWRSAEEVGPHTRASGRVVVHTTGINGVKARGE